MKRLTKQWKSTLGFIGLLCLAIVLIFGYRDIPLDKLKDKYAPPPSSFMDLWGMEVHFRDEGNPNDTVPMVLIHGTGSSLHTFDDWTRELKSQRRVIRMDLPAYGLTGPFPDRNYAMERFTEFLYDFLKSLNVKHCILGGNSFGGKISWNFALEHPDMVSGLILIDASGYPLPSKSEPIGFRLAKIPVIKNIFTYITPRFLVEKSVRNVYADESRISQELMDRYFELALRKGNRQAFIDRLEYPKSSEAYEEIPSISCPTLVLWGQEDQLIPPVSAYRFHEDLPNSTLVVLENAGHLPMEECPRPSLDAVQTFLKSF